MRAIPHATDGAHTAAELLTVGRGDCLGKAGALDAEFRSLGYPVRKVRSLCCLPGRPVEVALLRSREDVHTAVEGRIGGRWTLADATHDPRAVTVLLGLVDECASADALDAAGDRRAPRTPTGD
ncbi:transglutaminase domain-containing protein [Streptomyces sp. CAU 1734]|uniref:transglutaminase domain-containing protein n=1 Tax=Streptomyces sp. CAU 1734 TaxID=3140360 RepID=UPI0032607E75